MRKVSAQTVYSVLYGYCHLIELRVEPKSNGGSHEEYEQLEKLQGMFPQNSTHNGTGEGGGGE